ncbi:MAG: AAA family ATPase [Bacteroidota bacterium]
MIIIIFGLPGTGKSYLARRLASRTGAVWLNTDIVRKEMGKHGQYDAETNSRVYKELLKRTSGAARAEDDVLVDGTFRKKHYRDKFKKEAARVGEKVLFVEMKASEDTVKERMKNDRHYSEAGYDEYLMIRDKFEDMEEEHPVIWSDRLETDEMIDQLKKEIRYEEGRDR